MIITTHIKYLTDKEDSYGNNIFHLFVYEYETDSFTPYDLLVICKKLLVKCRENAEITEIQINKGKRCEQNKGNQK
jgi:hypothetical protein